MQLGGHGEDDVEVLDGEQIALLGLDPARVVQPLALGAMPIAAGVVGDLLMPQASHCRRWPPSAAVRHCGDGLQDAPLLRGQAVEVVRVRAHDVGQFPAAGAGRLGAHGEPLARGGGQAGQIRQAIQRALGGLQLGVGDLRVELRGAQAAVAEQRLDHAEVGPAFQQVGGDRRAGANRDRRAW